MKHSRSLMLPPALLAFILPAVLLNPNLEKLLAHGFLALVFYFALAIFHAEQLAHRPSPATSAPDTERPVGGERPAFRRVCLHP